MIDLILGFVFLILATLIAVSYGAIRGMTLAAMNTLVEDGTLFGGTAKRLFLDADRMLQVLLLSILLLFMGFSFAWQGPISSLLPNLLPGFVRVLLGIFLFITSFVGLLFGKNRIKERAVLTFVAIFTLVERILSPVLFLVEKIKNLLVPDVAEHNFEQLSMEGATAQEMAAKAVEKKESEVLRNVYRLADRDAGALMTSRNDVVWVSIKDTWEEMESTIRESGFTKIPVCIEGLDNAIGVIRLKDFIGNKERSKAKLRRDLLPIHSVAEHMNALSILEVFRKKRNHFAFVVDEFGTTIGVLTLHDLVESIFGDMPDEDDEGEEPDIMFQPDGTLLVEGGVLVEDLYHHLPVKGFTDDEEEEDYNTLAGYILSRTEEVPKVSDFILSEGYRFEVVAMDRNRIQRVKISKVDS